MNMHTDMYMNLNMNGKSSTGCIAYYIYILGIAGESRREQGRAGESRWVWSMNYKLWIMNYELQTWSMKNKV